MGLVGRLVTRMPSPTRNRPDIPNWPMIAALTPALRQHIQLFPQHYRGERWYVLHDESSGRHLRFNASAHRFIGRLDGYRSVAHILDQLNDSDNGEPFNQEDAAHILAQLFAIDALRSRLPGDAREFFLRFQRDRDLRRQRSLLNPLAIRIPLLDPDALLERLLPWIDRLFSRGMAALWLLVVGIALPIALSHADDIARALNPDILAPRNLPLMLGLFIAIKTLHEFAHAFAVKLWGGEVHEMGITLLVLAPIPYVDASAAWTFPDKHKRILVGLAGMLVELFIASLALFVWLLVEPGPLRDACLNLMLIGSVSTLLFNANPLLRYDGYYVLQDLIEIPNLYSRASRYWIYLTQRHLFGLSDAVSPVTARGEAGWFAVYGLLALCYRLAILAAIVMLLASQYLALGIALGGWAVASQLLWPIARGARFVFRDPRLRGHRTRAVALSLLSLGATGTALALIPAPLTSHADGVVWVSDQAQVYAATDGFVVDIAIPSGAVVANGDVLLRLHSPELEKRITVLQARHEALEAQGASERIHDRVRSQLTKESLALVDKELAQLRQSHDNLTIRSRIAGTFVLPPGQPLEGRWLRKGELIGYVLSPRGYIVRAVIPQQDIGLLHAHSRIQVRLAERPGESIAARIVTRIPAADRTLPSAALGAAAGGEIPVRRENGGTTAAEALFRVDLGLPEGTRLAGIGERARIRFEHGAEPLPWQWLRASRRLLLHPLAR